MRFTPSPMSHSLALQHFCLASWTNFQNPPELYEVFVSRLEPWKTSRAVSFQAHYHGKPTKCSSLASSILPNWFQTSSFLTSPVLTFIDQPGWPATTFFSVMFRPHSACTSYTCFTSCFYRRVSCARAEPSPSVIRSGSPPQTGTEAVPKPLGTVLSIARAPPSQAPNSTASSCQPLPSPCPAQPSQVPPQETFSVFLAPDKNIHRYVVSTDHKQPVKTTYSQASSS